MDLDLTIDRLCEKLESATDLLRNVSEEFGQVISDKTINLEARWGVIPEIWSPIWQEIVRYNRPEICH